MESSILGRGDHNFLVPNATIIVVFVIFLAILFFFYRFIVPPLTKAMAERDEMNRKQAEERDAAQRRLAEARERYDSALAEARAQATAIKDEARADAQRIREDMRAETDREVAEIHRRGAEELAEQRAQAVQELRGQVGGLSTDLRAGSSVARWTMTTRPCSVSWPSWTSGRPREGSADGGVHRGAGRLRRHAVRAVEVRDCRRSATWSGSDRTRSSARSTRPRRPRASLRTPRPPRRRRPTGRSRGRPYPRRRPRRRHPHPRGAQGAGGGRGRGWRMLQRGREQLVADRDQAVRRLRAELGGASMELAERMIRTDAQIRRRRRQDTVEKLPVRDREPAVAAGSVRATRGGGPSPDGP